MERQSSSEIKIAFDLLPVIWIGSWDSAAWSSNLNSFALASVAFTVVIAGTSFLSVHNNVHNVEQFILARRSANKMEESIEAETLNPEMAPQAAAGYSFPDST
jgi:hypothetical protein